MKDLPVDKGNNFDSKCWIVHSPNKNRGISRQVEVNMKWAGFVNSWLLFSNRLNSIFNVL